jgi:hypothetical protein
MPLVPPDTNATLPATNHRGVPAINAVSAMSSRARRIARQRRDGA